MVPRETHRPPPTLAHRFNAFMARTAPYAAAASAALILWHAARDKPAVEGNAPVALVYPRGAGAPPSSAATGTPTGASAASPDSGRPVGPNAKGTAAQQAGVISTLVVVGRNDTMDAIFRRMALDKADLAAIRAAEPPAETALYDHELK